jgi:hypothetical protein
LDRFEAYLHIDPAYQFYADPTPVPPYVMPIREILPFTSLIVLNSHGKVRNGNQILFQIISVGILKILGGSLKLSVVPAKAHN